MTNRISREELAKEIYFTSYVKGIFKLRSGKVSNEYLDKYMFESNPRILSAIADHLCQIIPKETQILAGLELGGIPLATVLSLQTGLPTVFVRKKAKEYGTAKIVEGVEIKAKRLCIIEDVVTTGGQIIDSAKDLRNLGATVSDVVCVIVRENSAFQNLADEDLRLRALFNMEQVLATEKQQRSIR